MLLRIASDLHLESFWQQDSKASIEAFLQADPRDEYATLMLAGDISSRKEQLLEFLTACCGRFKHVCYIPGNHEYYRHDFVKYGAELNASLKALNLANLSFAINDVESCELEGFRFILGTLWGDCGPTQRDSEEVGYYLNDFRLITFHGQPFTVEQMVTINAEHSNVIKNKLDVPFTGKTIVMTHHLPSRQLVSERYWPRDGTDGANGGFASNLDKLLIGKKAPSLWVHGHTHDTIDKQIAATRVVCNPAGYRGEWGTCWNEFMMGSKFVTVT